jgi:hypothetical protein
MRNFADSYTAGSVAGLEDRVAWASKENRERCTERFVKKWV